MPGLKKELSGKNIEFVYLAVSSREDLWKKILKQHKLEGHHYLLNDVQRSELYERLSIGGIPHYFILDESGNIYSPNAKDPNHDGLIEELVSLL